MNPQPKTCECGCGQPTNINDRRRRGYEKGEPSRFINGHFPRTIPCRWVNKQGYIKLSRHGSLEHVLIAEAVLGKALPPQARVHHHDNNPSNNAHTNLVICESQSYHMLMHARTRILRAGGDPDTEKICGHCKKVLLKTAFNRTPRTFDGRAGTCKDCMRIAKGHSPRYPDGRGYRQCIKTNEAATVKR